MNKQRYLYLDRPYIKHRNYIDGGRPGVVNWGEREQAPTMLMSIVFVYVLPSVRLCVHSRLPDCACMKSGYRIYLNVDVINVVFFNA